jgi:hypothetical protein
VTGNEPARASFPPDVIGAIESAREVEVTTTRPSGGPRRTIVWIVVVDGWPFVRSVLGTRGRWYQEILAEPAGVLHVGELDLSVRAVHVTDEDAIEACSRALAAKYAGDPDLPPMLVPEVLGTTLRLDPA